MKENDLLTDWVVQQYKHGTEIASMCTGAFMLAPAGLMDGKSIIVGLGHLRF